MDAPDVLNCRTQRHHRHSRCGMRFVRRHNFAMCTARYLRATLSSFYRDQRAVHNHACVRLRVWVALWMSRFIYWRFLWLNPKLWHIALFFCEVPRMFWADKFTSLNISYRIHHILYNHDVYVHDNIIILNTPYFAKISNFNRLFF